MMTKEKVHNIEVLASNIRKDIIKTGYLSGKKGAHFGGSLSMAEILATLYDSFVSYDLSDLEHRDRVILSKGHAALALYCTLYERGIITKEELESFEQNGSDLIAHSKRDLLKGQEFSGGSLSLGLSHAVGTAYACMLKGLTCRVYAIVGDGELNEGLVWEALMFANQKNLHNLTLIVDHNHLQADGTIEEVMNTDPLKEKLSAFGFDTQEVDGHSVEALFEALSKPATTQPSAIIAETVKGKGVSFMENKAKWHHGSLNESRFQKAMKELEEDCHG